LQLTHPSWQAQTAQTEALFGFAIDAPELASANSKVSTVLFQIPCINIGDSRFRLQQERARVELNYVELNYGCTVDSGQVVIMVVIRLVVIMVVIRLIVIMVVIVVVIMVVIVVVIMVVIRLVVFMVVLWTVDSAQAPLRFWSC